MDKQTEKTHEAEARQALLIAAKTLAESAVNTGDASLLNAACNAYLTAMQFQAL